MNLIDASDVVFGYGRRAVVRVDRLRVRPGECVGVYGPNGVGKTTLVRGLAGLIRPMAGVVTCDARRIGYVPQHRAIEMHWPMTGLDVACLSSSAHRWFGWLRGGKAHVRAAMEELGVGDLANRPFAKLSGGQQQRVILAGALADGPDVLILDEPTDGLDIANRNAFLAAVKRKMAAGIAVVLISHEVEDLTELGGDVAWLHPGDTDDAPARVQMVAAEGVKR